MWKVGDVCEGKFCAKRGGRTWYRGTIEAVHPEGGCDVRYDDGDWEKNVPLKFLRAPTAPMPAAPTAPIAAAPITATSAAPTTAAAPADGNNLIVSGKRKVRATTVMVDGQAVKRQNMYDMEEGEGSVWDRELSGKTDDAFAYRERAAPTAPPPKKAAPKPAGPRAVSAEERQRLDRNEVMRAAKDASAAARARFLEPHRAILERFGAQLPHAPKGSKAAAGREEADAFAAAEGFSQPKEIQVWPTLFMPPRPPAWHPPLHGPHPPPLTSTLPYRVSR